MASGVEETEAARCQVWVLKVSIHCEGCKKKVRKVLRGVHGVQTIEVDSKQNKVTVTGDVEAEALIGRLLKYGKHAELWPETKPVESNSFGTVSGDAAVKGTEKAVPVEKHAENTENKQETGEGKDTSPGKTAATVKQDAPPSGEDAAVKSDENEVAESEKDPEKPAAAGEASSDATEKGADEKGEQTVERDPNSVDERDASNSDGDTARSAVAFVSPPPTIPPTPAYPQPVYTMSYNMVHPSASYSHYAATPPPTMMSYYAYPGYPFPDPYYGSMEPSAPSMGSLDLFNDENPNACNLM